MANLADIGLVYKGIRPLQKLGAQARDLAETLNYPLKRIREEAPRHLLVVPPDPWAGDSQRGRDMIAGIFRFGGQTIARAAGHNNIHNLEPEDLCALTIEAAAMARVPLAGTGWIPGQDKL